MPTQTEDLRRRIVADINAGEPGAKLGSERELAEQLYRELSDAGVEVLFDDREKERLGVKLADTELLGIPHRVVIAERGMDNGTLEYKGRADDGNTDVPVDGIMAFLKEKLGG